MLRLVAGTLLLAACSSTMSLQRYSEALKLEDAALERLRPGAKLAIFARRGRCGVQVGDSLAAARSESAEELESTEFGKRPRIVSVKESVVGLAEGVVLVGVTEEGSGEVWLRLPMGQSLPCITSATDELMRGAQLVGRKLAFTPWLASCRELVAVGDTVASVLVEGGNAGTFEVTAVETGVASAAEMKKGTPAGAVPWALLAPGQLKVRADVVASCFSDPSSPEAKPPEDPTVSLRTTREQCASRASGHYECRTALGVWEGRADSDLLELRLTRRNLGAVHFRDGRPVHGARYASSIVAVTTGKAPTKWHEMLYAAVEEGIKSATASGSGDVRVVLGNVPEATHRIHIQVGTVSIGDTQQGKVPASSQYKVRDEPRPNPKKHEAFERIQSAQAQLMQAQSEYNAGIAEAQRTKAACELAAQQAKSATNQIGGWGGLLAGLAVDASNTGCQIAAEPSQEPLIMAQQEVQNAQMLHQSTPDTVLVPVMGTWNYDKTSYWRTVNATVQVLTRAEDAPAPTAVKLPLTYVWEDYDVLPDAVHNVEGHTADRKPMEKPEALVPFVAKECSKRVEEQLRAIMSQSLLDQARKALQTAGDKPAPEYEPVDATAYHLTQGRLGRSVRRGRSELQGGERRVSVAITEPNLEADSCLVVAATAEQGGAARLFLASPDQTWGDLRGGAAVALEMCKQDGAAVPEVVHLWSEQPAAVRWSVYVAKRGAR